MCAFPDIFGMTDRRSKGTKSRCEPRSRFRVTPGELGNCGQNTPNITNEAK